MIIIFFLKILGHMEWIPFGIRSRLIRLLVTPGSRDMNFNTDFFGLRYFGNLNNYIDWSVYFFGAYSKQELIFLKKILLQSKKSDLVVLDVGANVGNHTLFFSQYAQTVHAFEPCQEIYEKACYNISNNNIENVKIYPIGLGINNETKDFFVSPGSNLGQGSLINRFNQNQGSTQRVDTFNGDEFLHNNKIDKVDFIKIDVEGFEKYVLMGLHQTLIKYRPIIFMEFCYETKMSFGSCEDMYKILPEKYVIKSVIFPSFKTRYKTKLVDFNFVTSTKDILLLPSEFVCKV